MTVERFLDRAADIDLGVGARSAGARHYDYIPTYFLQGLTKLHLEFDPVS